MPPKLEPKFSYSIRVFQMFLLKTPQGHATIGTDLNFNELN